MTTRNRVARASLFVGVLVSVVFALPAIGQEWCGTRIEAQHVPLILERQAVGLYDPPEGVAGSALVVPLTFHVVRRSDGTGGLSDTRLVQALDDANLAFANAGIVFCWIGPTDYIDNDNFYSGIDTRAEIDALRAINVTPNSVNIYFTPYLATDQIIPACPAPCPICGISSFTWEPVQGIVMDNDCSTTTNRSTLPHELGHYFDLFHTHETWPDPETGIPQRPECPACSNGTYPPSGESCNCNVAGDYLCDTPADPGLGSSNVNAACNYTGTSRDPCSDSPYTPNTRNLMSYSRSTCRNHFSSMQLFRMQATLTRLRAEVLEPDCPGQNRWQLAGKLTASDARPQDFFGVSVAMSDLVVAVGATRVGTFNASPGLAYLFERQGQVWFQAARFEGRYQGPYERDYFGGSIAASNSYVVVGASGDITRGQNSGAAYVFRRAPSGWLLDQNLFAQDTAAGDSFGTVAVSGECVLIGAQGDDDHGMESGSAYVFEKLAGVWTETAKLTASDGVPNARFGSSVALSVDTALMGAPNDDDQGTGSGSVYVFEKQGGIWIRTGKLTAVDGAVDDHFGASLAFSGDVAVIGAPGDDDRGSNSGAVYVFNSNGGVWAQAAKLHASDGDANDGFGGSVSVSATRALVGAYYIQAAYVFQQTGGVWAQISRLGALDPTDGFGISLALFGDRGVVGANADDDRGPYSGSAYLFRDIDVLRSRRNQTPAVVGGQIPPGPAPAPATGQSADLNCDGLINNFDIDAFVLALVDPPGYAAAYPSCNINNADINADGAVNNLDIDPFVQCIVSGSCP